MIWRFCASNWHQHIVPLLVQTAQLSTIELQELEDTLKKLQQASIDNLVVKMPNTSRAMSLPTKSEKFDAGFSQRPKSKDFLFFFENECNFLEQSQMLLSKGSM